MDSELYIYLTADFRRLTQMLNSKEQSAKRIASGGLLSAHSLRFAPCA
jgi:hypothetical protein